MSKLPGEIDFRRFLRAMARFGWTPQRIEGSHHQLFHPDRPDGITVYSKHGTISRIIMKKVLKDAGVGEEAFIQEL